MGLIILLRGRVDVGPVLLVLLLAGCSDSASSARRLLAARGVAAESSSVLHSLNRGDLDTVHLLIVAEVRPRLALQRAIRLGDCRALEVMIDAGYPTGDTIAAAALLLAERSAEAECVEILEEAGVEIRASFGGSRGLPRVLIRLGHPELLSDAVRHGFDLDLPNALGSTLLMEAVRRGQAAGVRALIEGGAGLDKQDSSGASALHLALWQGDDEVAGTLLDAGADPAVRDRDGWDALAVAARQGSEPMVRRLLGLGVEIDSVTRQGSTPLILAVFEGHVRVVGLLLEGGADALAASGSMPSALEWAVRQCRASMVADLARSVGREAGGGQWEELTRRAALCRTPAIRGAVGLLRSADPA